MGLLINLLFAGAAFIVFAVSAGFLTDGTRKITTIPGAGSNNYLNNAHKLGTYLSVVAWIVVALLLVAIVLYIIYGSETAEYTGSLFLYFILFVSLAGVISCGVVAAIMSYDINKSGVPNSNGAYKSTIISTVLAIISFVLLVILFLIKVFYKPKKKESKEGNPEWLMNELESDPELAGEAL